MLKKEHNIIDLKAVISGCLQNHRESQMQLFQRFKTPWYMICLRYLNARDDADDALQNALIKIYTKLKQFDPNRGSFEGWSKRIVVNECIMFIRKHKWVQNFDEIDSAAQMADNTESALDILNAEELTKLIQQLPDGYRMVFNMYAIEGYSHKEIAKELNISEGTSKSQLFKAKKLLKKNLEVLI